MSICISSKIKGAPCIPWPWGWRQAPPGDGGGCFAPGTPAPSPTHPSWRVQAAPWPGTLKIDVQNGKPVSTHLGFR